MNQPFQFSKSIEERAVDLHTKSIVVQALDFTPEDKFTSSFFPMLKESGITAMNLTIARPWYNFHEALISLYTYSTIIEGLGRENTIVGTNVDDIRKAKAEEKIAIIFGLQNTKPIGDDIRLLTILYKLGIRVLQLTYQNRNLVGDGCNERVDCGLTRFGEQVVAEMNRLGMLIDLSHVGPQTALEAIDRSKDPCAFTHTCARSLFDHIRNKTDEQMKALCEKGGVIGIAAYSPFFYRTRRPTLEDYLNHIEYVVNLVGADHVGIGLDSVFNRDAAYHERVKQAYPEVVTSFDWDTIYPEGLENITKLPNITKGLVARGYSDSEIEKILGANFLRVFANVWSTE